MQIEPSKQKQFTRIVVACVLGICVVVLILTLVHHRHPATTTGKTRQAIVDITPSGFVPATLNVKPGTIIIWQNQDSATHKVGSDPYPMDTSVSSLRSGAILPNGSYRFTSSTQGTIRYHDDTRPTLNGTIIVSE